MDYLSNLKQTTGEAAYKAVKKTERFIANSKVKYRIHDVDMEIEGLYAKIGRELYLAYTEDREVSDIVEEKCREIDELIEKRESLQEKLSK